MLTVSTVRYSALYLKLGHTASIWVKCMYVHGKGIALVTGVHAEQLPISLLLG